MAAETLVREPEQADLTREEAVMPTYKVDARVLPRRRLLTVAEFDCAWAQGVYGPEERLELIEGEVIEKVSPQRVHMRQSANLSGKAAERAFREECHIRTQLPLVFGPHNKPEPDVAVVVGSIRDYSLAHPTTAVLIIEISDSTLRYDRTTKAGIYARAGIADYWILNVVDRVLEVHRQPAAMTDMPLGHGYRSITRYIETEIVSPLVAPDSLITVADLLP